MYARTGVRGMRLETGWAERQDGTYEWEHLDAVMGAAEKHLAEPHDPTAPLDARARGYLAANCAHCHRRWGGGNSTWQLLPDLPLRDTGLYDAPPAHGDFGIQDARLIAPGHPECSLLLDRMTRQDKARMPRVGGSVVDDRAVNLIREWISEMEPKSE